MRTLLYVPIIHSGAAINASLKESEVGVLFIGAAHNLIPLLEPDIAVTKLKDPHKVKSYFEELVLGKNRRRFEELSSYLASPAR